VNANLAALQQAVAEHPFLQGLNARHLETLTECAMLTHFEAGQVIFHEGEIANRFYLIQRGQVCVETQAGESGVLPIQTIGAGNVLGWSWLFPPYYWHFGAYAMEPTDAIFFYGTRLRERCEEDPTFGYELMKRVSGVLLQRLQGTLRGASDIAQNSGEGPALRNPSGQGQL
jgi:CRP/FNR family cyclic AMP-dependent transcriptional regulator